MNITVKLFALLGQYLPAGAEDNAAPMQVAEGATPKSILLRLNVPLESCHLVLINGVYIAPDDRDSTPLKEGDVLAVWPPVAGG